MPDVRTLDTKEFMKLIRRMSIMALPVHRRNILRDVFSIFLLSSCSLGSKHRNPALYADPFYDDNYWLLHQRWSEQEPSFTRHDTLGWVGKFDPLTLRHDDENARDGRTPVLLFGDSFSACVPEVKCFEELINDDPFLSQRYQILNYGVGGYGLIKSTS